MAARTGRQHHREVLAFLTALAATGHAKPALLARQILLLMDGMIAAAMVSGDDGTVLAVAERTLDAILGRAGQGVAEEGRATLGFQSRM